MDGHAVLLRQHTRRVSRKENSAICHQFPLLWIWDSRVRIPPYQIYGRNHQLSIRQKPEELHCPVCGSYRVKPRGQVQRRFRAVPIGRKAVWVVLSIPRVLCSMCGVLRQVRVNFACRRRSYTRSFERYTLELSRHMTIKDVARHLGNSWDVIKDIRKGTAKTLCLADAA